MHSQSTIWLCILASALAAPGLRPNSPSTPKSYPLHLSDSGLLKRQSTEQMDEDNGKHVKYPPLPWPSQPTFNTAQYAAILTLGTGQNFNVLVDTGSTDLFLPAAGAGPHNSVQPDPSIVPYPGSPACMENYGGNSQQISGTIYTAPFTFAGTTTGAGSPFCLVSDLGGYRADPDGVLGLQPCASGNVALQTGACPLGSLGWSSFGIYLSSDDLGGGGFITPNDVNRDLFDGDFKWETIVGGAKHWTFSLGSAQWYVEGYVDNLANQYAFIDTGNPTIKLDPASVDKIWASIGAEAGTGAMNCTDKGSAPDITFTFGSGNEYTVPSSIYVVASAANPNACRCVIQKLTTDPNGNAVFGAPFVKLFYTFFDNGEGYLGFAPSIG